MPKKIQECTKAHLVSVPLPNHGASYTVISHQFVIDYAYQALANAGFGIVEEEYRCTHDGQIAQGIYKLHYNSDPELSMMFAWTNSYNKQVKFKCIIGAYINETGSVMTSGDIGTWTRKHMGTADTETKDMIDSHVQNAYMYYNQLVSDKADMENISLNKRRQAQMLGILFAEFQILTTEQASLIRQQMDRPLFKFKDPESLWAFYNYVTIALQHSHPRTWMEDQRVLHYFMSTVGNFQQCSTAAQVVQPANSVNQVIETEVDPNQINLLDAIAEAEAKQVTVEQAQYPVTLADVIEKVLDETHVESNEETFEIVEEEHRAPEPEEYPVSTDEVIQYTDPAGNTFEAPLINMEEESSISGETSITPTPADYEMIEAIESSEGTPAIADLDTIPVERDDTFSFDLDITDENEESDNTPDFF